MAKSCQLLPPSDDSTTALAMVLSAPSTATAGAEHPDPTHGDRHHPHRSHPGLAGARGRGLDEAAVAADDPAVQMSGRQDPHGAVAAHQITTAGAREPGGALAPLVAVRGGGEQRHRARRRPTGQCVGRPGRAPGHEGPRALAGRGDGHHRAGHDDPPPGVPAVVGRPELAALAVPAVARVGEVQEHQAAEVSACLRVEADGSGVGDRRPPRPGAATVDGVAHDRIGARARRTAPAGGHPAVGGVGEGQLGRQVGGRSSGRSAGGDRWWAPNPSGAARRCAARPATIPGWRRSPLPPTTASTTASRGDPEAVQATNVGRSTPHLVHGGRHEGRAVQQGLGAAAELIHGSLQAGGCGRARARRAAVRSGSSSPDRRPLGSSSARCGGQAGSGRGQGGRDGRAPDAHGPRRSRARSDRPRSATRSAVRWRGGRSATSRCVSSTAGGRSTGATRRRAIRISSWRRRNRRRATLSATR